MRSAVPSAKCGVPGLAPWAEHKKACCLVERDAEPSEANATKRGIRSDGRGGAGGQLTAEDLLLGQTERSKRQIRDSCRVAANGVRRALA